MKHKLSHLHNFSAYHPLISGTMILTGVGFLSRIIGFFYRIYLSRLFGEEGMGIYQLIHPIIALSFSLTASAFQTAISKLVAEQTDSEHKSCRPLILGASISIPLSLFAALLLFFFAEPIAAYYLCEPRTAILIKFLSFTLPFSAAHACANGYFYGIRKASVPAWTQFLEQVFRVTTVYILAQMSVLSGREPSLSLTVIGLVIGEIAGIVSIIFVFFIRNRPAPKNTKMLPASGATYPALFSMVIPLTANKVFLNFLQSVEATTLPASLRAFGYDDSTALSVYGVLTGMAFPLIVFPTALTNSISVLLLPTISENMALRKKREVKNTIIQTIQYCSVMGFFCMAFFLFFGKSIGNRLFHSQLAGYFIGELSFLCPFLYLNSTLSGILQGLGKVIPLFICNITSLLLRLAMIYFLVPVVGIKGYLWGLLASQIVLTALCILTLIRKKDLRHT